MFMYLNLLVFKFARKVVLNSAALIKFPQPLLFLFIDFNGGETTREYSIDDKRKKCFII